MQPPKKTLRQVFIVNVVSFVLLVVCANMAEAAAPVITAGPVSQTVSTGQNVTFSVSATGSLKLQYQWMKGGSPISGATGSTLSLSNVQATDAYPYSVSVSNSQGTVVSDLANLIVVNSNNPGGSSVYLSPQSKAVPQGTGVSWSVSYQASRYTWRKNGSTVRDDWQGGYWSGVWPTTTSTYSISSTTGADSDDYDVIITVAGTGQQITSTTSKLVVNVSGFPTILTQPSGGYVGAGNPLNLSVYATGTGTLLYQWYKNGQAVAGANSSTYNVNVAETSDAGTYEVLISNSLGSVDSAQAIISVLERPQLLPSTKSVSQGGSASWSITASGVDRFTWRRNGSAVWSDYQYGGWSGVNASATSTYTINPVLSTHAGTYDVVVHRVSENVDVVSTPSVLNVSVANEPYIVQQPSSTSSSIGSTVQFSVVATGTETLRYQWKRNGENLPNGTSSTLTLSNVQSGDALKYTVVISNTYGTVTSSVATLTLESTSPGATLTPSTRSVPEGVQVSWNYNTYNGSVYTWRKNGVTVWQDNKGSGWSGVLGWTSSTYTIPSTQLSDTGDYDVVVQPLSGGSSASSVSALTVVKLIKTAIDTDGDGVADDVELADGTNPNDPASFKQLSKGLVAWYPFNGNAMDASGYGNDLTVNGATLTSDRHGNTSRAYLFNGSSSLVSSGRITALENQTHTVSAWVRSTTSGEAGIAGYVSDKLGQEGNSGYVLTVRGSGAKYAMREGRQTAGGNWEYADGDSGLAGDGQWHQLVGVRKDGTTRLFIDGTLQAGSTTLEPAFDSFCKLYVGSDSHNYLQGSVSDLRVYNRALSIEEISLFYQDSNMDGIPDVIAGQIGYNPSINFTPLIEYLKNNPSIAGLYNQVQNEASRASGRSDVTTSPNAYGLYTPTQIMDLNIGGITIQRSVSTGSYTLNYVLEQSTDLQSWSTYRTKTEELTGLPSDRAFIRIHTK